jgi:hypothetical protein
VQKQAAPARHCALITSGPPAAAGVSHIRHACRSPSYEGSLQRRSAAALPPAFRPHTSPLAVRGAGAPVAGSGYRPRRLPTASLQPGREGSCPSRWRWLDGVVFPCHPITWGVLFDDWHSIDHPMPALLASGLTRLHSFPSLPNSWPVWMQRAVSFAWRRPPLTRLPWHTPKLGPRAARPGGDRRALLDL